MMYKQYRLQNWLELSIKDSILLFVNSLISQDKIFVGGNYIAHKFGRFHYGIKSYVTKNETFIYFQSE